MGGEKLGISNSKPGRLRITPAWAGKSSMVFLIASMFQDHPRMGGEKSRVAPRSDPGTGSPPHGRGKVGKGKCGVKLAGITPAWAGKSLSRPPAGGRGWDHPRMGGEKPATGCILPCCLGSPPHGRGKGPPGSGSGKQRGITPAWAGKRPGCGILILQREDHPRMGGEKSL